MENLTNYMVFLEKFQTCPNQKPAQIRYQTVYHSKEVNIIIKQISDK
jgi:hypothetical protein